MPDTTTPATATVEPPGPPLNGQMHRHKRPTPRQLGGSLPNELPRRHLWCAIELTKYMLTFHIEEVYTRNSRHATMESRRGRAESYRGSIVSVTVIPITDTGPKTPPVQFKRDCWLHDNDRVAARRLSHILRIRKLSWQNEGLRYCLIGNPEHPETTGLLSDLQKHYQLTKDERARIWALLFPKKASMILASRAAPTIDTPAAEPVDVFGEWPDLRGMNKPVVRHMVKCMIDTHLLSDLLSVDEIVARLQKTSYKTTYASWASDVRQQLKYDEIFVCYDRDMRPQRYSLAPAVTNFFAHRMGHKVFATKKVGKKVGKKATTK